MALSIADIRTINANRLSTLHKVYYGDDGHSYIGISNGRLERLVDPSQINFGDNINLTDIINNITNLFKNKEVEVDFGNSPYQVDKVFSITDTDVKSDSIIMLSKSLKQPSDGRDSDEIFVETLDMSAKVKEGGFDLYIKSLNGSISGKFIINYNI